MDPQKTKRPEEEVSRESMSLPTHCSSLDTCGSEVWQLSQTHTIKPAALHILSPTGTIARTSCVCPVCVCVCVCVRARACVCACACVCVCEHTYTYIQITYYIYIIYIYIICIYIHTYIHIDKPGRSAKSSRVRVSYVQIDPP
jgi:hypothetical protein